MNEVGADVEVEENEDDAENWEEFDDENDNMEDSWNKYLIAHEIVCFRWN